MAFERPVRPLRIVVTTGDPDGIGLEVTAKALLKLGPQRDAQFTVLRSIGGPTPNYGRFRVRKLRTLDRAAQASFHPEILNEVSQRSSAADWVEEAARACSDQRFSAMVTAPLSKTSIIEAGFRDLGHTEILARISGRKNLFMGFVGAKFGVLLGGGHESLSQAAKNFTPQRLKHALRAAEELRAILPPIRRRRPMALVGMNPHAGEGGLIGREERWMKTFCGPDLEGPLVPDAAFLPKMWKRFSVYITPYHDQGLIPFKLVHGFKGGVHLTLGLPFVRTSVDHGTAKELFGLNQADGGSMLDALKTAILLARREAQK